MVDLGLLKKVTLFEGLNHAQLAKVAALGEQRKIAAGAFIFRENTQGEEMYLIEEGKVRISKTVPGIGEEALAILEPGSYFGEMAVMDDAPRSADAIAHISCTLQVITKESLDQLMFIDKEIAYILLWTFVRTMAGRLRETNEKIKAFFALSSFR